MAADMPISAAASSGRLLRLDRRLYRLQCRFDLVPRRSNFPQSAALGGTGPGSANNFSTSPSNGIFGFHAGAQWQWGAWVLGAEAALSGCFRSVGARAGLFLLRGFPPTHSSSTRSPTCSRWARDWATPGIGS